LAKWCLRGTTLYDGEAKQFMGIFDQICLSMQNMGAANWLLDVIGSMLVSQSKDIQRMSRLC
jgi:hypothetical protein